MPRDSLKKLMDKFPWFFDKSSASNFYKSQSVTNSRFKEVYNDLFKIYESFHLNKRLYIWKEQSEPYVYKINFVANLPYLKSVTLTKNDEVIYKESFLYEDNVNTFTYSYNDNTVNDVEDVNLADIIPPHRFKIEVETYDEYSLIKGWPENDTSLGDEFDHDSSLDRIGKLHNIPRKDYLIVDEVLYAATEPPYNDRASEDDYHYMQRILEYMMRYHTTPLPVLEIWKLYGIEATMENREKLLLKVFDLEKHPNFIDETADGDQWFSGTLNDDGTITEWTPKVWEHLDKFCDYSNNLGKYFFVKASTNIPVKNQNVIFYFKFIDGLAHDLDEVCTVDILLNNKLIYEDIIDSQFTMMSSEIPQDRDNTFTFIARDSKGELINSQNIIVIVRGCNKGNFYVNPDTGNDNYNGKTRDTPFKTIQKAVNSVNGDENLIILLSGDYEITSPVIVNKDCAILGCGSVLIENLLNDLFFRLSPYTSLILQDLTLQYKGDVCNVSTTQFTNNNGNGESADVIILFTNTPILTMTRLELDFASRNYSVGDTIQFTGSLKDRLGTALASKTINVTDKKNPTISVTTNNNGVYTGSLTAEKMGELTLNASYNGDSTYKSSVATATISIKLRLADLLSGYDYIVMNLEYDEDTGDWNYLTKPVTEILKLSDLYGAVLNLQYNNGEVSFERFYSYSNESYITKTDMEKLRGLLVGIVYDEYNVKYTNAHIFGESVLTITTESTDYLVGDTITFTGTLMDKYNDPIKNKSIVVNGQTCVTNNEGVYTGTVTVTEPGIFYLNAMFNGDHDYEEAIANMTLDIRIPITSVLSDYDYIVMDLEYDDENHDWKYIKKPVADINSLSDINNAVKNLTKVNDNIIFERFTSTSTNPNISKTELQSLNGLLTAIVYDDYEIKYTKIQS